MPLYVCDVQFVPMFTPCSAASFRLKNMRLPIIQSSVGLPRPSRTEPEMSVKEYLSLRMLRTELAIALEDGCSSEESYFFSKGH